MPSTEFWRAEADAAPTVQLGSATAIPHFGDSGEMFVPTLPSFYTEAGQLGSLVEVIIDWYAWQWPETRLVYEEPTSDGYKEVDHPVTDLLERPAPQLDGGELSSAYVSDLLAGGRAQLHKVRNFRGDVIELTWLPTAVTRPELPVDRSPIPGWHVRGVRDLVPADDVIYFRYKLDPADQRLAVNPLLVLGQETLGDAEAAKLTTAMLANHAFPGIVISPDWPPASAMQGMDMRPVSDAVADTVKKAYQTSFGGANRGEPMVLKSPTRITQLDPHFEGLDLSRIRAMFETRAAARYRLPPIVVGFDSGLARSTFSNFEQAQRVAYVNGLTPVQRRAAATLTHQLLPEFEHAPRARLRYDYSDTPAMQENENERAERLTGLATNTIASLDQVQEQLGIQPIPGGPWYLIKAGNEVVPEADIGLPPEPVPAALAGTVEPEEPEESPEEEEPEDEPAEDE